MRVMACSGLVFVLLLSLTVYVAGAKKPTARKEDVPFIKCAVCERLAENLFLQMKKLQQQTKGGWVTESKLIEVAENICDHKKAESDWTTFFDIQEDGNELKLKKMEYPGECGVECLTVQRACGEVMDFRDTDIAEYIHKHQSSLTSVELSDQLCYKMSDTCLVDPPPVPKDRKPGEPFVPMTTKTKEYNDIMRKMGNAPGQPKMKLYHRDDIMKKGAMGMGNEDDDDEEEETVDIPTSVHHDVPKDSGVEETLRQAQEAAKAGPESVKAFVERMTKEKSGIPVVAPGLNELRR